MSGSIVDLSRQVWPKDLSIAVEICIIGSGSGGATAARVLAEAGREVVVLEEGGDFTGKQLTQRDGEMYDQLYMDRAGRMTDDLSVTILQGRVLGGGGVINASDVVPMPDGVLEHWQRKYGLSDFRREDIAPHAQLALQDLHANPIQEGQLNLANQMLRKGTQALKLRGEVMQHNRVGCGGLGTCLIGCPLDAKKNPRLVAIPKALEAGARFYTRARAVKIEDGQQELKRIVVHSLDSRGYHEKARLEIRAKVVILAANAINSAQLLLRSGLGNGHVGRHLSLQPQLPAIGVFKEKIDGFRGIPQAYAVTEYEQEHHKDHGLWGFRIESIMGTPGIVSTLSPYAGVAGKEYMTRYPHLAAALLLVPDQPTATIRLSRAGRPVVRFIHQEDHKARLRDAIKAAARIYLAAGAQHVEVPVLPVLTLRSERDLKQVDSLDFPPASAPLISAHQQGGVRFSASPRTGAANPEGLVYGTRGIYVFDSSGFPSSASSHTMTPIIAFSRYLCSKLLSHL